MWELPLVAEYKENLKNLIADLRNISKRAGGDASTIIGGLFLQEFTEGKPWVHLDIAGPSFSTSDTDLGPAGVDNEYGSGLINPRAALRGMGVLR